MPAGPKGHFPGVATHGWGIPVGSEKKDAAWEFIKWAMSKEMTQRMLTEKGYGSATRRSVIDTPEFHEQETDQRRRRRQHLSEVDRFRAKRAT